MPFEALLFLMILLAVVTVIGHGIWVVLAWIVRAMAGTSPKEARRPSALPLVRAGHDDPAGTLPVVRACAV